MEVLKLVEHVLDGVSRWIEIFVKTTSLYMEILKLVEHLLDGVWRWIEIFLRTTKPIYGDIETVVPHVGEYK